MRSKYERKCQKELEADNWLVDWKIRPSGRKMPRGYNVDYFGRFDILAMQGGDIIRWISIKGHGGVPKAHREAVENFKMPDCCIKEIWTYGRNKKVRKEIIK